MTLPADTPSTRADTPSSTAGVWHDSKHKAAAAEPTTRLLDSVARITVLRDTDALDHSLVLSLSELTSAARVVLDKHASGDLHTRTVCRLRDDGSRSVERVDPDVVSAAQLDSAVTVNVRAEPHIRIDLFIEGADDSAMTQLMAEGFARIYNNYLALIDESERDKLTGLYNRRSLERHLQRLAPTATSDDDSASLWLAIFDIDHFKRINDTYGHLIGDEVILLLARHMTGHFAPQDVLLRFGGEEFVALIPGLDAATARAQLESFRLRVAETLFPQVEHVTISTGYTRFGPRDHPELALDRADKALYFAKEHGRDRVERFETLATKGLVSGVSTGSVDLF